jgi:hypothetical protein
MQAAWDLENFPKARTHDFSHAWRTANNFQGCWNMMGVNFFTSSVNTILDFIIFALPIHTLFHLQMVWKKKSTYGVHRIEDHCSNILQ